MKTIKSYIKPQITVITIDKVNILSSSGTQRYICSEFCKLWHICRDRSEGKYCSDKEY